MPNIVEYGYHNLPYLEFSYLTGQVRHGVLVQIDRKIENRLLSNNSQVDRAIDDTNDVGVQIEKFIDWYDEYGAQVDRLIVDPPKDVELGLQIEKKLDKSIIIGTQVNKLMVDPPDDMKISTQVEKLIIDPPNDLEIGTQVEVILSPVFDGGIATQIEKFIDFLNSSPTQIERMIIDPSKDINLGSQIERYLEKVNTHGTQIIRTNLQHVICQYYLNTYSYLTTSYLAGCLTARLGVQVDKGIFSVRNHVGTQAEKFIIDPPKDVELGTQVEMKVDDIQLYIGSQIEKILNYILPIPTQIEKVLKWGFAYGSQVERYIFKLKSMGVQVNRVSASEVAVQVFKRLYNITQLRILDTFLSRGIVSMGGMTWTNEITGGIATGDYNVNNLNTDIIEQITKSSVAERRFKIYCNTGIPNTFVDTIAILNHNFTPNATIDITGFKDLNDFNNGIPSIIIRPVIERDNIYWISPDIPLKPAQYWRFDINDALNPFQLQMGVIVFGSSRIMTMAECFDNPVNYGFKHYKDSIETEGFTSYSIDRATRRNLGLSFSKLRYYGNNYEMIKDFYLNVKTDLKALVIPRPTKPSALAVFAKLNQLPTESHEAIDDEHHYVTLNLDWDEAN